MRVARICGSSPPENSILMLYEERSGSSAMANRAIKQGREVIVTLHVKAKIAGATLVENLGELKDTFGIIQLKS